MNPAAFVFDAYGTLFDVSGDTETLFTLWRRKQLEFTWTLSLMGRYQDFWTLTEAALRFAVRELDIAATESQIGSLMQTWLSPSMLPDVRAALDSLAGARLAILSNGSPPMLESAVRSNGLASRFTEIISADQVKTYKPSPRVYALAQEILKTSASEILFVSSNTWDIAGASAFGYKVCWCNRKEAEMEYPCAPDFVVTRLDQIPAALASRGSRE